MGCSGRSTSEQLTSTVTLVLLLPSCTTVVSSDVAVTLLLNALISMICERSESAEVPRFIRLKTSLK